MSADVFRRYLDIIEEAAAQQPWGETPPAPDITGMQPGEDRDLGDGSRVRLKADGTIEYSGHWGTHRYNSAGQHIGYTSPSFSGHQVSFDAQGRKTQTYSAGPLRMKTGPEGSEVDYDLGPARVQQKRDAKGNIISQGTEMKEGEVTPANLPRRGLNRQQRQAPQLPALFHPKKISVLKNKTDPQHPAKKYYVGDSREYDREPVEESQTTEDVISMVKKGLNDYLSSLQQQRDPDRGLLDKAKKEIARSDLEKVFPLKTILTHDGRELRIHGNEADGFQIRVNERPLASTFQSLEEAVMACEMYCAQREHSMESQASADYVEEKRCD
jgi:hypothetical protein